MGYTTDFEGQINIQPPLNPTEIKYLSAFFEMRHMHREDGPYYVGGGEEGVFDQNQTDPSQPKYGLWCDLEVAEDGTAIRWNGSEKSYAMDEWMEYIIEHFIGKDPIAKKENSHFGFLDGHTVEGIMYAQGEDSDDTWQLHVSDGKVFKRITG